MPQADWTILIVDDEAQVRASLARCLEDDYRVLSVASGPEALTTIEGEEVDLVLCDHAILTRLGSDFVRRLRDDPLTDFVPVVALMAPGSAVDAIAVRELGAADALVKPIAENVLEPMVQRIAARRLT